MNNPLPKKILIGIDGSEHSMISVRYICELVRKEEVEIVLFHVQRKLSEAFIDMGVQPVSIENVCNLDTWESNQKDTISTFMQQNCDILTQSGFGGDRIRLKVQPMKTGIARDIIEEAQNGYDAVVVGRKGVGKIQDLVIGSIASKLVEGLVDIPVCVVGEAPDAHRILIGVDASEGATRAVDYLKHFFTWSPERIRLVKVFRNVDIFDQDAYTFEFPEYDQMVKIATNKITPVLEKTKRQLGEAGFNPLAVDTKIITDQSSRAQALIEEAQREGFGTIIVGRRGLSKVEAFLMGSVSSKVVSLGKNAAVWIVN